MILVFVALYLFAALWAGFYGAILSANVGKNEGAVK